MRQIALKETFIVVILSLILALLYVQSRQADHEEFYQVSTLLQKFASTDLAVERDVLKLRAGYLHHYDTLTGSFIVCNRLLQALKQHIGSVPELSDSITTLESSLAKRREVLDVFKRNNALFRNSLRYFPIAIDLSIKDRPELRLFLNHILNDLLQSVSVPEEYTLQHLEKYLNELNEKGLLTVSTHLKVMIESDAQLRISVDAFAQHSVGESVASLLLAYEIYHNRLMQSSEFYRIALVLFSGLLVLFVGVVMLRLQRSAVMLRETNAELQYQKFALDEHAIVAVTDHAGAITYANQKFIDASGYSQEELLGKNHRILKSGYHSDAFYREMWQTIVSGKTWHGEIKNRKKDGGGYWVAASIVPFMNAKGEPYKYVAIRTDITAQKEFEEAQKKLSAAFYYAAEALMITDAKGSIEHVNPAFESMTGYCDIEIQGQSATLLRSSRHDDDFYIKLTETLDRGEVWKGEVLLLCRDGSEKSTLRSIAPVFNEKGDIVNYVTFIKDITEDKLLRSKMEHTQRLESLGVMAGGIAHDFNNILTSIMGNAKLAELKMGGGKRESFPYLSRIAKASERAADLCRQMLAYSGQGSFHVRPISLTELVGEISTLLKASVADHVSIDYQLVEDLPAIEADTGQLQQVVMNLITNAGESYEGAHGRVRVDVGIMYVDRAWMKTSMQGEGLEEGDHIYIEVKDSGIGMDETTLGKIFEPFFTTKFTGRGLGMSAIMGIVRAHRGGISINSVLGEGTIIRVVFPVVPDAAEPLMHEMIYADSGSKITVMVVDDEPDILELAEVVLMDLGHDVITATSAEQALEIFRQGERSIDMVITDATMPGMSGEQLCDQIHAMDKRVKLVLSSGYDVDHATRDMQSGMLSGFIQKPYSPKKFSNEVSKILEA